MTEGLIISGERREAADGATFDIFEPATGQVLTSVSRAGTADVDASLAAAHRAFDDGRGRWARTNATERGRVLQRVAQLIREREDDLASAEARGAGHPIGDARWEVGAAAGTFESPADEGLVPDDEVPAPEPAQGEESFLETVFSAPEKTEEPADEDESEDTGFGLLRRRGLGAAFRELADS